MVRPSWLDGKLVKLSWVSLLQDAASEMLYPIVPVLLNTVFGAPALVVGAIESLAEGVAALTKLLSGRINHFMSKRSMVIGGYGLAAVGKVLIALAGSWPIVMLGRVVDRFGKGMRSASRDAILLEGTETGHRGKIIGFHRTADNIGAVAGPAIALGLLSLFDNNLRPVLWIAAIPAAASVLVTLTLKGGESKSNAASSKVSGSVPAPVNRLIVLVGIFSLVNFPDALVLLHLSQSGWGLSSVIGLYLLFNVSATAFSFPAGMISDRLSPKAVYSLGLLCFSLVYFGFSQTTDHNLEVFLVVLYGLFAAINETVGKSWVGKLAGGSSQLLAQSRLAGWSGFGVLFAGIWAGLAWGSTGTLPLLISGAVGAIVAVVSASIRT